MEWNALFPAIQTPTLADTDAFAGSPLWEELRTFLEETYGAQPRIEYSRCSAAPGWNVKYKKGSRSLCTVYIRSGYVTALVSVGQKEAMAAEAALPDCTAYLSELYRKADVFNGGRWLMIDVTTPEILRDVKTLLLIRAAPVRR